jgi:predicted TIM-barrel fold metal-dependent hydrolase
LWVDTSHLDGLDCVRQAVGAAGPRRLLFATCWPFFYAESAALKFGEAQLSTRDARAVMEGNARAAFGLG